MEVAITSAVLAAFNGVMSVNVHGIELIIAAYRLKRLYQCLCRDSGVLACKTKVLACKQYSNLSFASFHYAH